MSSRRRRAASRRPATDPAQRAPAEPRSRPGGRSARVREAVLQSAFSLLTRPWRDRIVSFLAWPRFRSLERERLVVRRCPKCRLTGTKSFGLADSNRGWVRSRT